MARIEEISPQAASQPKRKRGPSPLVTYYLVLYNILSTLGWAYVLARTANVVFNLDGSYGHLDKTPLVASALRRRIEQALPASLAHVIRRAAGAYAVVGPETTFVQSFAALEVVHVLLGWVRSPLATTLTQVFSRLYLVWGITYLFPAETHTNPIYGSMVLSWSLTEVVRYTFYACSLVGREPYLLIYLRYTLFYVLYPTGASSEAFLIFSTLSHSPVWHSRDPLELARFVSFVLWWPGLYVLYTHMMKQRRKVLRGAAPTGRQGSKLKSF